MGTDKQWIAVAQAYAERHADALLAEWGRELVADGTEVGFDRLSDVRAEVEAAGLAAFLDWRLAPSDGWRQAVVAGSRKRLRELSDGLRRERRVAPARADGMTFADFVAVALELGPAAMRARFGYWPGVSREAVLLDAVAVASDRAFRRWDPARGQLRPFVWICLRSELDSRSRQLAIEKRRLSVVAEPPECGGFVDTELERFEDRADASALLGHIDTWVHESGSFTARELAAWTARRAGGEPGDANERRAWADAVIKIRQQFRK